MSPVVARLRKLTIMQACRVRCRRLKRTNSRSGGRRRRRAGRTAATDATLRLLLRRPFRSLPSGILVLRACWLPFASRASSARSSRRISTARGSHSKVCTPPTTNVPSSRAVIPQNDQNRNGYFLGSWWVAWVRYPAKRRVASLWHFWQVATTLARLRCDRGSVTFWMSCAPWQS